MKLLSAWRRRWALRRYARELPKRLYRDYGASEYFTAAQIKTAVGRLGLDDAYIVFGYAMFLPEDAFNALLPGLRNPTPYTEARSEFLGWSATKPSSANGFYESGLGWQFGSGGEVGGSGSGHSGHDSGGGH
jgi:hypothetical protein